MATQKLGVKIEIDGETKYKQAIEGLKSENRVLSSEMRLLSERYKGNENSLEALQQKSRIYVEELAVQQQKVETVRQALENARVAMVKVRETKGVDSAEYALAERHVNSWRVSLNDAEREQTKLERALEETNKALEDEADGADEAGDELADLGEKTDDASDKTSIFSGVLKANLVQDAIHFAIDGLKELGEMAIDFGKKVIDSYGELEQNLGGSEAVLESTPKPSRKRPSLLIKASAQPRANIWQQRTKWARCFRAPASRWSVPWNSPLRPSSARQTWRPSWASTRRRPWKP